MDYIYAELNDDIRDTYYTGYLPENPSEETIGVIVNIDNRTHKISADLSEATKELLATHGDEIVRVEGRLDEEISRAEAAEAELLRSLTEEIQATEEKLSSDLEREVARAQAEEASLSRRLSDLKSETSLLAAELTNESEARLREDVVLTNKITAEVQRAEAEESRIETTLRSALDTAESNLSNRITGEELARITADNNLNTSIENVNTQLTNKIESETSERALAIEDVTAQLMAESEVRIAEDDSIRALIQEEAAISRSEESKLAAQINNAVADLQSEDAKIRASLSEELTARVEADKDLSTSLSTEITDRKAADTAIIERLDTTEEDIDTLEGRATAAEDRLGTIEGRLDVIEGEGEGSVKKAFQDAKAYVDGLFVVQNTRDDGQDSSINANKAAIEKEISDRDAAISGVVADYKDADLAINNKIGSVTEGKTVVDMISDAQAAAVTSANDYTDSKVSVLENGQVKTNKEAIATLSGTVTSEITKVEGLIIAEETRAKEVEADLQGQITLLTNGANADEVDSIKDLIDYVNEHGTEVTGIKADIDAVEIRVTAVEGRATTLEGKVATLEAKPFDTYATKTEVSAVRERAELGIANATAAQTTADNAQAAADAAQGEVDTLEGVVSTLRGEYDVTKALATTNETEINTLKGRVSTAEGSIATLETASAKHTEKTYVDEELAKKVNVTDYTAAIGNVYTKAEADGKFGLKTAVEKNTADINTNTSNITALTSRLDTAESDIDNIETDLSDYKESVTTALAGKQDVIPANTYDAYGSAAAVKAYVDGDFKAAVESDATSKASAAQAAAEQTAADTYLPKSGGTIIGNSGDTASYVGFQNTSGTLLGYLGYSSKDTPAIYLSDGVKTIATTEDLYGLYALKFYSGNDELNDAVVVDSKLAALAKLGLPNGFTLRVIISYGTNLITVKPLALRFLATEDDANYVAAHQFPVCLATGTAVETSQYSTNTVLSLMFNATTNSFYVTGDFGLAAEVEKLPRADHSYLDSADLTGEAHFETAGTWSYISAENGIPTIHPFKLIVRGPHLAILPSSDDTETMWQFWYYATVLDSIGDQYVQTFQINIPQSEIEKLDEETLSNLNFMDIPKLGIGTNIKSEWKQIITSSSSNYKEITYAELKVLRDNKELIPGMNYRIMDYVTTTSQSNTQSAGHPFDIIVTALSIDTLSENALVDRHSSDSDLYFTSAKLEAWEIKYCLDNDKTRFVWADEENGKGVIYYMKDEWDNECHYDFKNIMFKRSAEWFADHNDWCTSVIGFTPTEDKWFYTFSWVDENSGVQDLSLIGNSLPGGVGITNSIFGNKIGICSAYSLLLNEPSVEALSYNVFVSSYYYKTGVFYGCYSNTLGDNCYSNTFSNACYSNIFGTYNYSNTLSDCTRYNIFENGVSEVTLTGATQGDHENYIQNITVSQGIKNKTITATRNLEYQVIYRAPSSTEIILD